MIYHILTLFPEQIKKGLSDSIIQRALDQGKIALDLIDIRDYAVNRYGQVDDYPYGGGAGMVMQAEPIVKAYRQLQQAGCQAKRVIYMTPKGRPLKQKMVEELANEKELIILCGHYEGIDQRALDLLGVEEISIGDYVLTGGELAAMVMVDAISRQVPGVLANALSMEVESFDNQLLEYPQYTRPYSFEGLTVPDVLLSGHHQKIETYRRRQAIRETAIKRPDLLTEGRLASEGLTDEELNYAYQWIETVVKSDEKKREHK